MATYQKTEESIEGIKIREEYIKKNTKICHK